MSRLVTGVVLAVAVLLAAASASAQCQTDYDCKGDRICQVGECVDPPAPPSPPPAPPSPTPPTPAPAPAPAASPEPAAEAGPIMPFQSGFAEAALFMSFYTFGRQTWEVEGSAMADPEFDATTAVLAGIRLAGCAALTEWFHLGGYFAIRSGQGDLSPHNPIAEAMFFDQEAESDVKLFGLGAVLELGGRVSERVWLGGGADVGIHFYKIDEWDEADDDTFVGLELFPRLVVQIILVDTGGFRLALPISAGAFVSPISVAEPVEYEVTVRMWHVAPAATVGLALGR